MSGTNVWKDIKGYEGKYQVSYEGEIRRIYKNGKTKIITPYIRKSQKSNVLFVGLTKDGKKKEIFVHKLVAEAFLRKPKKGEVIYHVNGLKQDNYSTNLKYIDRKKLGKMTGAQSRRKGVVKINSNGEMVDFYSSARQAARKNFMSYQTLIDRCNRKVKSALAPDGFAYAWEDCEVSIKNAMKKLEIGEVIWIK